jgi:gustatory receptor
VYTGVLLVALLSWHVYSLAWSIVYEFRSAKLTYAVTQTMTLFLSEATSMVCLGLEITRNRRRLIEIMSKLSHVDGILMPNNNKIHKRVRGVVILELVLFIFLLLVRHGYELWSRRGKQYLHVFVRFFVHIISTIMIVQFATFTYVLKQRFHCVNRQLALFGDICGRVNGLQNKVEVTKRNFGLLKPLNSTSVPLTHDIPSSDFPDQSSTAVSVFTLDTKIGRLPSVSSSVEFSQSRPQHAANMHTLRRVYAILYDLGGLVESAYGFQLLLAMAYIFFSVVKHFNLVMISNLNSHQGNTSAAHVDGILPFICVVSIHIANVLWITASCNFACSEAVRTTTVVNKLLLIQALSSDVSAELERFSQQLLHSKLHFTAFGFFSLDFTFLYGFIGGATTYIVILLQLQ